MPAGVSQFSVDPVAAALTDLVLPDLEGTPTSLASFHGRPALFHVFATWCEPCRDELPRLIAAARDLDLPLCVVSMAEPASRVRRFLGETGLDLPVLLDTDRSAAKRLGLSILPSTWILDRTLTPRFVAAGDLDWSTADVRSWLAEATT